MHGTLSHFDSVPEFLVQDSEFRTSRTSHWLGSFSRGTRLPVSGSLMKRCRFQTSLPMYSSLFRIPVPRCRFPLMVEAPQARPPGATIPPAFSS
jgi:hypothetical protein